MTTTTESRRTLSGPDRTGSVERTLPDWSLDTAVGTIVTRQPATARLFELVGIDYCRGGGRTLERACRENGLDPHRVLASLLEEDQTVADWSTAEGEWQEAELSRLIDHIEETHHAYLRRELPRLRELVAELADAHGERYPELAAIAGTLDAFADSVEHQLWKEERQVFPVIRLIEASGRPADITGAVLELEHEHDHAREALARIRALSRGFRPPPDASREHRRLLAGLAALEVDLHRHLHKENEILFTRAITPGDRPARSARP